MKKYRNPNVPTPTPSPSTSGEGVVKPPRYVGKPVLVEPPKKRRTPPGITGPEKRERRPLPKPINKSGLKKDGPSGKRGSLSMSVKKPLLISRKKIGGR